MRLVLCRALAREMGMVAVSVSSPVSRGKRLFLLGVSVLYAVCLTLYSLSIGIRDSAHLKRNAAWLAGYLLLPYVVAALGWFVIVYRALRRKARSTSDNTLLLQLMIGYVAGAALVFPFIPPVSLMGGMIIGGFLQRAFGRAIVEPGVIAGTASVALTCMLVTVPIGWFISRVITGVAGLFQRGGSRTGTGEVGQKEFPKP